MKPSRCVVSDVIDLFKRITPLAQQASHGNTQKVRSLLNLGNTPDLTAVVGAAMGGHHECLKLLLPGASLKTWELALNMAVMEGYHQCVCVLLNRFPEHGHGAIAQALLDSVCFNNGKCTQILVEFIENITTQDHHPLRIDWNDLLFKSVRYSNPQAFFCVFPHCNTNCLGLSSCLQEAVNNGLNVCVQKLVPFSEKWPITVMHDILMIAISKGDCGIVQSIVPWVDVTLNNSAALCKAIDLGNEDIAELLYDGSDLDKSLNVLINQNTPPEQLHRLEELILARTQNAILSQVVDQNVGPIISTSGRKM